MTEEVEKKEEEEADMFTAEPDMFTAEPDKEDDKEKEEEEGEEEERGERLVLLFMSMSLGGVCVIT